MFNIFANIKCALINIEEKIDKLLETNKSCSEATGLTQEQLLDKELLNNKKVEFYSNSVNGWIATRMEKDKSILTLSTAGIGVLVSFFNTINIENIILFSIYIFALLSFVISIFSSLHIFGKNADYFMAVIGDKPKPSLKGYDKILLYSFMAGLLFTIALSIMLIINNKPKVADNDTNSTKLEKKYITLLENKISLLENKQKYSNGGVSKPLEEAKKDKTTKKESFVTTNKAIEEQSIMHTVENSINEVSIDKNQTLEMKKKSVDEYEKLEPEEPQETTKKEGK